MVSDRTKSRGQLILIGALMLATVILGLSMLLNSMLFTGATGDTGASAAVEETNFVDYDVELGARELLVRLNHDTRNVTASELGTEATRQFRNYSRALAEARARSGSVAVSVDFNSSSSFNGTRIIQSHNTDMNDPDPVTGGYRIGWFSMSANASAMDDGDEITIRAENSTSPTPAVEITIERNASGVRVESSPSWRTEPHADCSAERGRVLLDIYAGRSFTDTCEFTGIGALGEPTHLEFSGGGNFEGKYAIVTNRSYSNPPSRYQRCRYGGTNLSPANADPCIAPVIWNTSVTTTVVGDSINYENTYNLTVYTNER